MAQNAAAAPELLDAATIARLGDLKVRARVVVEGALAGLHRSPHHGSSVEFSEHKEYSPGDELRHIDWKAYGKSDKLQVKRFEEETELHAYLMLDCSASMGYRGGGVSKLEYAGQLAGALAYLLLRQQDAAGVLAFADERRAYLPPRNRPGQLGDLLSLVAGLAPAGGTDVARAIGHASDVARRRSLLVLFSDLLDSGPAAVRLLRGLRARHHDVVLFHVLDGDELDLPEEHFGTPTIFVGMESGDELLVDPRAVRRRYLDDMRAFLDECRRGCLEGGVDYQLADTRRPPAEALLGFLRGRRHERRVR